MRSHTPLGKVNGGWRSRGTSAVLPATRTGGHGTPRSQIFISCHEIVIEEFIQDGLSIVSDTITNSTVILDVSEDLVASRVRVVG